MNGIGDLLNARPDVIRAQVVVVGSGPGGSITASLLAEAGREVLLVEEGPWTRLDPSLAFTQAEMVGKYRNGGVTVAMGRTKVAYVEGRCVGGGSEINSGLYHRTPAEVLAVWGRQFQVSDLDELQLHFEACERDLSVSLMPGDAPMASRMLAEGAYRLGWRAMEVPRWQRYAEGGQDPAGKRQTMSETFVPRFLNAGGRLLSDTRVKRLRRNGSVWRIYAEHRPPQGARRSITLESAQVFAAAGAIQTPLLLRKSGIRHNVGNELLMHPTVKVVAQFPGVVNSLDMGVPVHQVKEFSPRISFGCSISRPPYLALAMNDHPEHAQEVIRDWPRAAIYYAMITGQGHGSVRSLPGFEDPLVRYRLAPEDYRDLAEGLVRLCRLLLAAGATTLYCGVQGLPPIHSEADLAAIPPVLPVGRTNLMTIHLFSSCPMGENRQRCAANSFGRVHQTEGLYIADASLLCTAPSVNPQGSVMAFARRNALHFLEHTV